MTTIYEVLRRPMVTEKSSYQSRKLNQYTFEVSMDATRTMVKDALELKGSDMELLKENAKIMHPLPRVTEIKPDVDDSPHALYFKQIYYGLMMRKALLALLLGKYPLKDN